MTEINNEVPESEEINISELLKRFNEQNIDIKGRALVMISGDKIRKDGVEKLLKLMDENNIGCVAFCGPEKMHYFPHLGHEGPIVLGRTNNPEDIAVDIADLATTGKQNIQDFLMNQKKVILVCDEIPNFAKPIDFEKKMLDNLKMEVMHIISRHEEMPEYQTIFDEEIKRNKESMKNKQKIANKSQHNFKQNNKFFNKSFRQKKGGGR